jgi:hypothetical protein
VRFHSTGTYIKTREMADHLGKTPAEREQYLKLMNAALDGFGKQAAAAGFQNDLAMALSYFLAENIRIYRGLPELSDQQYVNLRNVIAEVLVSGGALNKVTDRQKQEFYEALVAYTGVTQFGYEQAKQAGNDQNGERLPTSRRSKPANGDEDVTRQYEFHHRRVDRQST